VIYLSSTRPPTILFSITHDNLLFLSPSANDIEPLLVLEFLHRVADALEEFLGAPLLATKLAANYDLAAQVVAEMADAGVVCQGEANALRDVVETGPGVLKNLLGNVGLPGSSPAFAPQAGPLTGLSSSQPALSSQGSAIPWRRSNVRHTNNELKVDIVESVNVILAPSGRPLCAFAHGSIAFTSQVSGVPDLLLTLSSGSKGAGMGTRGDRLRNVMERVVFHPCVRLSKWSTEGVMSFVPPDGRFVLCGYEVDLLGPDANFTTTTSAQKTMASLNMPATIELNSNLGPTGADFEVRITPTSSSNPSSSGSSSSATASLQSNLAPRPNPFRAGSSSGIIGGDAKPSAAVLESLTVHIPIPALVRNISDLRPTRGEAHWNPAEGSVEWRLPAKEFGGAGAVLRCTLQGPLADDDDDDDDDGEKNGGSILNGMSSTTYDYDEEPSRAPPAATNNNNRQRESTTAAPSLERLDAARRERHRDLMPTSATLSFAVKGRLASGLKVESLLLDAKKSRELGAQVKPYKGVKYLTVSRKGVEVRC
jgi:hypothetical protein